MVVGKVSEFIGSLYYLCVTLLRFKNIMKLKNYLLLFALLLVVGVRAQVPSGNKYPKREFRGAWIQAVNGQFKGIPTGKLKQTLIDQLNSLQGAGINAIIMELCQIMLLLWDMTSIRQVQKKQVLLHPCPL